MDRDELPQFCFLPPLAALFHAAVARKLEFHDTPKHGSWLNAAECELAVLASQCPNRRLPDLATVDSEVAAWERKRNVERPTVKVALHYRPSSPQVQAALSHPGVTSMVVH